MRKLHFTVLLFLCSFFFIPCTAMAGTRTVTLTVNYDQSEARHMLDVVNSYRSANGKSSLTFDYKLEQAAMQRAAEIAVSYSHTRPDNSKWSTAIPSNYTSARSTSLSENICRWNAVDIEAEGAVDTFKSSSSHNAAMLDSTYRYAGFGYAEVDGFGCWVQLFHSAKSTASYSSPVVGTCSVNVTLQDSLYVPRTDQSYVYAGTGQTTELPVVWQMAGDVKLYTLSTSWSCSDPSVGTVSGNRVFGTGVGSADLYASTSGGTCRCYLSTSQTYIYGAKISLSPDHFIYNGRQCTPAVTVDYYETRLTEGKDYTLQFSGDRTNVGNVEATITGIGYYAGETSKEYSINRADQNPRLSLNKTTLCVGDTASLSVSGAYGDRHYETSNYYVASVSTNGVIKCNSTGTATITVYTDGDENHYGGSAKIAITVKAKPTHTTQNPTVQPTVKPSPTVTDTKPLSVDAAPKTSALLKKIKKLSDNGEVKGSAFGLLRLHVKSAKKNSLTLAWSSVSGADGYIIYGNACGKKNAYKKLTVIKDPSATSKKISKIKGKKLKKCTYCKFIISAVKMDRSGTYQAIAVSKSVHATTAGHKKNSNYRKVSLKNPASGKLTLRRGGTFTIKASAVRPSGKKVKVHRKLSFESTAPSIAKVSKKGVIRAVSAGSCYVYVYSQNGKYKRILVTVTN